MSDKPDNRTKWVDTGNGIVVTPPPPNTKPKKEKA